MPHHRSLIQYWQLVRTLGWRWVLFRLRYALRVRSGMLRRRTPMVAWDTIPVGFEEPDAELRWEALWARPALEWMSQWDTEAVAREILKGRFLLFGFHRCEAGEFPDWHKSPLDEKKAPEDTHWSALGDFGFGDIKNIWELSRWPWAFALARAWHVTRDNTYAERFWALAEDWMQKNPPNCGVNWKCGQETAFRLFAAVFARMVLGQALATTPERLKHWRRLVWVSGRRIAANLDYALSQANNHGVSECVGLMTAGALVGGGTGRGWFSTGETHLRAQLEALVYEDGGFSQHSTVYHRVLLHDLLWAAQIYRLEKKTLPVWLEDAGSRAVRFLGAMVDDDTGQAHLYGANDGSNVLSVSGGGYEDFRPTVQAGARAFLKKRWWATHGEYDELSEWLGVSDAASSLVAGDASHHFSDAGVYVCCRGNLSLLFRCPQGFRHRPSKADLLHLSVLWKGKPVLLNPGSFSYNTVGHFAEGFSSAFVHNTATVDSADQLEKFSRFLYLPWPRGDGRSLGDRNGFDARHFSYERRMNAVHTRRVLVKSDGNGFVVEDEFESKVPRRWRLQWLLVDGKTTEIEDGRGVRIDGDVLHYSVSWETASSVKMSMVRADKETVRGWCSPYYQHVVPALSLALELTPETRSVIRTTFAFG